MRLALFTARPLARRAVLSRASLQRALVAALILITSPGLALGQTPSLPGSESTPSGTETQVVPPVTDNQAPPSEELRPAAPGMAPAADGTKQSQPPPPSPTPTSPRQSGVTQPNGSQTPGAVQAPTTAQPNGTQTPGAVQAPATVQTPGATQAPATTQSNGSQTPGAEQAPATVQSPDAQPVDGAPATVQSPDAQPVDGAPATVQSPDAQPVEGDPATAQPADASATDDEAMLAESSAPPPGFTGIHGKVVDEANQEGLIEATVKVVTGAQKQTLTDLDGNYRLALPPGKYDLRVFYDVYQGRRITGVIVTEGKATKLDVALGADVGAVQEVVVEARADRRAEGALLQERKKAAAVSDAISAQEIARTPDSSASDAVKRVVSATVVDGRYVYLRGLGGRYITTLLNGALLPSPEPDEPSVPLDLFPTSLLANLNVVKSYTADLPGSFGGGALLIETNTYPSQFEFKPRLTFGGDTETTGQARNTQTGGGGMEFLGFPGGSRRLPSAIPTDHALGNGNESLAEQERQWESFNNVWNARSKTALPNIGLSASLGDTLRFDNQRLGYLATVNYGHRENTQFTQYSKASYDLEGNFVSYDDAQTQLGTEVANLSGLASVGYQLDRDNELTLFSLFTRGTETRTTTSVGVDSLKGDRYEGSRLQFVVRQLSFNQLRGFHRIGLFGDSEVDWQANLSRVDRDEPDTRDSLYSDNLGNPSGGMSFPNQANSGERFFADLGETSFGGSVNITVPLADVRLKVGGLTQLSFRDFRARRFRYGISPSSDVDRFLPPETLFGAEYLGNGMRIQESTRPDSDAYDASLGVFSGYVTADVKATEALRLVGGLRLESTQQKLTALNQFTGAEASRNDADYLDWLPTLNTIYALTPTVNLRAGYSYTLARPTFRELAPFTFYDFVRRRNVSGNPALVQTRIHNADARVEWFTGDNEVLAASVFYKRFLNPIERVVNSAGAGDMNFENTPAANTYGLELEARTSLGRVTPALQPFKVGVNLTLIQSNIDLGSLQGLQTNAERPMQGQSPYVVNVNLGYERPQSGTEVALLYNVYGRRINEVGTDNLPDVYEQPFHRMDLAVTQKLTEAMQLKLTASNLLNSRITFQQGDIALVQYRPGLAFSASLGLSL
ncbi:TonB-dependent receptor [Myxococcus sp. CA051A]|uniref:TonB-dependent receptor domain-containing protein n=1 Tax=Myxococcus sp. CA051A TaxID=2741739 RepID=UPI00157A9793|nr:TonB-dependent receptor [Myxococcus sp. CA051A]NTX67208.1 TonB-dependent receptor [Myxococcus sp. CA051A]